MERTPNFQAKLIRPCLALVFALAVAMAILPALSHAAETSPAAPIALPQGGRLFNLVPAFIAYAQQGKFLGMFDRVELWSSMLESRWPDFFNQVLYRNFTGRQRDRYKARLIATFFAEIAPKLDQLQAMNQVAPERLAAGLRGFQQTFGDFNPKHDYYLTVSFSFNGKIAEVNGKPVLALGLEKFIASDADFDITVAHELFHLHHFATFSTAGALYRGVWAEGLATYASAMLAPGHRLSRYLGFTGSRMNQIHDNYQSIAGFILRNLANNDRAIKRACLGMEDNSLGIPPGAGYYIGVNVVQALIKRGESLASLARWSPEVVLRNMRRVLTELASGS